MSGCFSLLTVKMHKNEMCYPNPLSGIKVSLSFCNHRWLPIHRALWSLGTETLYLLYTKSNCAWCQMPVSPELRKLRQEDHQFKARQPYTMNYRPVWSKRNPFSKISKSTPHPINPDVGTCLSDSWIRCHYSSTKRQLLWLDYFTHCLKIYPCWESISEFPFFLRLNNITRQCLHR